MMRFDTRKTLAVVPLLLLALSASVARADSCVTPEGTIHSSAASTDGSLRTFTGDVMPFGPINGGLIVLVNPDYRSFTGQFALKARGGVVYGTLAGHYTSANTYMERLTFTGGTGKYAGIHGYADVMGTLNFIDGTGIDTVTGGQICLPDTHTR